MKSRGRNSALVFCLALLVAGCASTTVTQQTPMAEPGLPRPNRIWVYDFFAAPGDIPSDSSILSRLSSSSTAPGAEDVDTGRRLGALIAKSLVDDINAMGLTAVQAGPKSVPQAGDGVIRAYLVSAEGAGAGGTAKRFVIGLGAGTSELDTVVEGYAVTPQGWKKLGSGTLSSSGNKTPGMVAPAAVAIATGSPVGLIVVGGLKVYGEASGRNKLEGRAKATADAIAEH